MITYLTIGTNDLAKATSFFDPLFAEWSAKRAYQTDRLVAWQFGDKAPLLIVNEPFDKQPATVGNGTMVALQAESPARVDQLHALALSLGATDEGAPGYRGKQFYGAYFRDLDGNKFNVHVIVRPS